MKGLRVESRDVGVLGGGLGALVLAALLAGRGHRVTVYERDQAGGKLRRVRVGAEVVATGPSLFTFPEVWRALLSRLDEADPLDLRPLPGGLGVHHTPHGPVPLPVPPGHPLFADWQRYEARVAPLRPHLGALLTTPPQLTRPAFLRASRVLFGVTGPQMTAEGWLRALGLPPALGHALRTHALNAGLPPQDAPALYALIPALVGAEVLRPAAGMGALLDGLLTFAQTRGVQVREGAEVVAISEGSLSLTGGEVARHDLLVSGLDPARLAALRGRPPHSPPGRRTVSGLAIYAVLNAPTPLPATSVLPPDDFAAFRAAQRAGALPPDTLALVHADGPNLAVLLSVPATGQRLDLTHPWVRGQLARVERRLGVDGLLAGAREVTWLDPAHYSLGGHPGGALYGRAWPLWRAGPFHPQPYRLTSGLWQVGAGVHPGGGIPAVLGGALIVDTLLREAGV